MNTKTAPKKITILIDRDVHRELYRRVGKGNIGKFISKVIRPYITDRNKISEAYKEMSLDKNREKDAREWSENLLTDLRNER